MPRTSKLLTPDELALATKNGIPKVTVYKRLDRGWDVEKAVTQPTRKVSNSKRKDGLFVDAGRGKTRFFSLPSEYDKKLDKVVKKSGKTESEWLEELVKNNL